MRKHICFRIAGMLAALSILMPFAAYADEIDTDVLQPAESDVSESESGAPEDSETGETDTIEPDVPGLPLYTRPSDRINLDEGGHAYFLDGEERIIGRFSLEPDFVMGDVTNDAQVDASDAAIILTAIANAGTNGTSSEAFLCAYNDSFASEDEARMFADVDENGVIDPSDAARILEYCAENGANHTSHALGYAEYIADENGFLQTGFIYDPESGTICYADESYQLCYGWLDLEDKRFYLDQDGALRTSDWVRYNGASYYMQEDGSLLRNAWLQDSDHTYYLGEDGAAVTGFAEIDGATYYFSNTGSVSGWVHLAVGSYFFDEQGVMLTGWLENDGQTYYLDESGIRQSGWQTIDGVQYYFSDSGCMTVGWAEIDGNTYYFGETGSLVTGWLESDEGRFYFDETGVMLTDQEIDGLYLGSDGKAMSALYHENQLKAQEALEKYGTSVDNIYTFVRSTSKYKKIESTKTIEQIEALGWLHFVDYSMKNYYGVCYYLAAKMDFVLTEAGYECRIVHTTHNSGDHYWNQIYINGEWVNYDCTNGLSNRTWDQMVAYGGYRLIEYVRPIYQ